MDIPVENFDPKPKRKNDDKRKGHAGRRARFLGIAALVVLGIVGLVIWTRPRVNPQFPDARLFYTSGKHAYTLNLRTEERMNAVRPQVIVQPEDNAAIVVAEEQIRDFEHTPLIASPNNEWLVGWKHISSRYEWELMLYPRDREGNARSLGVFHGVTAEIPVSWSPDSDSITFSADAFGPGSPGMALLKDELWLVTIPSGEVTRLTNNDSRDLVPNFSPDGKQIVYVSSPDGLFHLSIMDLATRESRLISSETNGYNPVWSPDGQWIAYTTNLSNQHSDIWVIRPNGADAQPVVQSPESDLNPQWLPPDA